MRLGPHWHWLVNRFVVNPWQNWNDFIVTVTVDVHLIGLLCGRVHSVIGIVSVCFNSRRFDKVDERQKNAFKISTVGPFINASRDELRVARNNMPKGEVLPWHAIVTLP
uniref:Uncharacterized protein n=1 Tax=Opuntia streptacantha TaxID=393608 RepID=A0A7C9AIU8_OPUST